MAAYALSAKAPAVLIYVVVAKLVRQGEASTRRISVAATRCITVHTELTVLIFKEAVEGVPVVSKDTADANVIEDCLWIDLLIWEIVVRDSRR
jgi:hypothetical protein